jgi:hypothetical protein
MLVAQALVNFDNWVVLVTFWVSVLFVPVVSTFWLWWKEPYGRATVSIEILIGLALAPGAIRRMFDIPITGIGFLLFSSIVVALIPIRLVWLFVTIYQLQREPDVDPNDRQKEVDQLRASRNE